MSYAPPIPSTAYTFTVALRSQADPNLFQVNPTLAAGDFQVSINGGAFANLANLPTVAPAGGRAVQVTLTAAEMAGDNITVVASDVAGAEWCDEMWGIQPQTEGTLLRAIVQGMRADTRQNFKTLGAAFEAELEKIRVSVLDLGQALLRGKG